MTLLRRIDMVSLGAMDNWQVKSDNWKVTSDTPEYGCIIVSDIDAWRGAPLYSTARTDSQHGLKFKLEVDLDVLILGRLGRISNFES